LMFSFMNTSGILRRAGLISHDEWNFLLRGSVTDFRQQPNPIDYIDEATWHGLLGLQESHPNFREIIKSFQDAGDKMTWKAIMREENPEKVPLPALFAEKLTDFQHLMLIKVLRKTKMIYSVKQFNLKTLGKYYIESPPMKLEDVLNDSTPITPIIFVLSPGADPIAYLMALAAEKGMKDKLKTISLGQGQDVIATKLIDEGSKTGLWICFQNCHLYTSWMGEFEKLLEKQDPSLIHAEYRLWLTSDPTSSFPVPILQNGIKLTQEPPRGLKANMARTFQDIGRKRYEEECDKGKEYRKLVFALAYFHSAILERRKYGAIGWNVSY
jgi:dynein heavy chain